MTSTNPPGARPHAAATAPAGPPPGQDARPGNRPGSRYPQRNAPGALDLAAADYLLGLPGPFTGPADLDAAVRQLGAALEVRS